jgi:tetratricopeptide (TPR) repeat protein
MRLKRQKDPRKVRRPSVWLVAGLILFFLSSGLRAEVLPQALARAQKAYSLARSNYLASPAETQTAAALARACFELSELSKETERKAALAEEGIGAARFLLQRDPNNGEGVFFLALNLGELARTKSIGALPLLRQMEKALLQAATINPHLEHAGPDRSLGLLYLETPGWPVSIGSKRKAREHLEQAVKLEPDYPDNHLSLLEAFVRWNDPALAGGIARYVKVLPDAKKKYSGPEWEQAWHDWEERWQAIQQKTKVD